MYKVVLVRHGESVWNKDNLFTGWTDVDLSEKGIEESKYASQLLIKENYTFDLAYTSVLMRAINTLLIILEGMDLKWVPIVKSWKLNERMYGALQGLNKAETVEKYGEDQVFTWRRSYDTQPPALEISDDRYPGKDPRYKDLKEDEIPLTECLKDVVTRVLPYWNEVIGPSIKSGKKILIAAHGNSLRALIKYLDDVPDNDIAQMNIPTGIPLVYELDENLRPIKSYYLGDPNELEKAIQAVKDQLKSK